MARSHTLRLRFSTDDPPDRWVSMPLVDARNGSPSEQATTVAVAATRKALWVRFECSDRDAWGTLTERDDPLWQEEVVEVFLAPERDALFAQRYVEIEVSPLGTVFDAVVANPMGDRREMTVDTSWDLDRLEVEIERLATSEDWRATIQLPWRGLLEAFGLADLPNRWWINLYRIERPRDGSPEYSAWSPTYAEPADFHRPRCFGVLTLTS